MVASGVMKVTKKNMARVQRVEFKDGRAFAVHDPKWSPTHGLTLAVRVTGAARVDVPMVVGTKADRFPKYRAEVGYCFCCRDKDKFNTGDGWDKATNRLIKKPLIVFCRIGDSILPAFTEALRAAVKDGRGRPGRGMGIPDEVRWWLKYPNRKVVPDKTTLKQYVAVVVESSPCSYTMHKVRAVSEDEVLVKLGLKPDALVVEAENVPVLIAKLARMIAPPGSGL